MRLAVPVVALVVGVHVGLWALFEGKTQAPEVEGPLASISFAPYHGSGHPDSGNRPTAAQIRSDLKIIAPYTRALRTYSSTGGVEQVAGIAGEFSLRVTVGAWIDKNEKRNERELRAALDLAKTHRNVNGIVVGNETIYRGEKTPDELIKIIQRVKRESPVPVTTGEIWHVWIEHPELASAVDYIAAHILPYWEGFSEKMAVDQAILIYDKLRQAFPGKRIVIAEFGWPSAGYNVKNANPGRLEQAMVMRDFVARAEALGIDYNVIEATDQPWKIFEGSVGPYWGMFNAAREPKFSWTGPIVDNDYWKKAGLAVLFGFLLSLPVLTLASATFGEALLLAASGHAVGGWFAAVIAYWNGHYFVVGAAAALLFGIVLLIPLIFILLSRIEDIATIAFGEKRRQLLPAGASPAEAAPKVSIHIPAYREPPEMLRATLDAVARLDYPNFECVVVINNTPDPAFWQPIEAHCEALGERFKFVLAEELAGFKAGGLRLALTHTAPDAAIVGVLDADYIVHPDWLKDVVPAFVDPTVGLVQAPQDHRDGARSLLHTAMNGEYAGFFDIGMVERNETNAIIVHGTMCLIRRAALEAAGDWSSDTICEDTDLGLTILELGWRALYTNRRYGHGLLPASFDAYKRQRHRWAYGGMQIIKKHWRRFLPNASLLNSDQKREYALGWLNWLGAESIGVAVAILNLIWVPVVALVGIAIPDKILTLPIIAAFFVSVLHFVLLYRLRVAVRFGHMIGAVFAAMSLQWTVARAVGISAVKDRLPFVRTDKGGAPARSGEFPAFWEACLGALLILGAIVVIATNRFEIREIYIFAAVLLIQSIPFLSAAGLAAIETGRANDFAFWRGVEARLVELLPRRLAIARASASAKAEKPLDAAQ
jgi:exo-beta-1,3-glucanase (GH17 family)/cellulose synthase/poly-beta-1,6-N-acetylglucosamine synthase-like glycosyltransferase